MAYNKRLFTKISSNTNSPELFTYESADTLATIVAANYFNAEFNNLQVGDLIYVYSTAATGGGNATYKVTASTLNSDGKTGVVTISA